MKQTEDGKEDPNILAKLSGEEIVIDKHITERLTEFVSHVFDHRVGKVVTVGQFLDKAEAERIINECQD